MQVTRAVRFCSAFSLPIVSILLHSQIFTAENPAESKELANLIFAYGEAAVPKLAVLCGPQALAAEQVGLLPTTFLLPVTTSKLCLPAYG